MTKPLLAATAALSLAMLFSVSAQQPPAKSAAGKPVPPAQPVTQALKDGWAEARRNIRASADVMPEAKFGFKPVATVRSFGAILAHVAGANYEFCAAAKPEKTPHAEDEFEKTATTRAAIVKALDDSLAYCDAVLNSLDDTKAAEVIAGAFGGPPAARASAIIGNTGHVMEHYGNLVTYMRINGLVPPSSAPRQ